MRLPARVGDKTHHPMFKNRDAEYWLRLTGHMAFAALTLMSVFLARERVLMSDSAAQLFELTQMRTFVIYDSRFAMAVTQLLPLLAIWLYLPLKVVLVAYSVSAPLLAWGTYSLIAHRMNDVRMASLMLITYGCMRHTFFHAISETFSIVIYATLLLALFTHRVGDRTSPLTLLFIVLTLLATLFIHPVGIFFVLFILGYHLVERRLRPTVAFIVAAVVLVAATIVRSTMVSEHDASFIPTLSNVRHCVTHLLSLNVVQGLKSNIPIAVAMLLLYAIAFRHHLRERQWMRMAYGVAFNVGFIALCIVVYRDDAGRFSAERAWLPMVFFAAVPVVREVGLKPLWLALLMVFMLVQIGATAPSYHVRIKMQQAVVEQGRRSGSRKLVVPKQRIDLPRESWATAFETLILSSLAGPDSTVTLYIEKQEPFAADNPDYAVEDAFLAVPWYRLWNYSTLDEHYFRLPKQPYTVIGR